MKKLIIYLKGLVLGFVGLAFPGLSASTVAIEFGIYYELIDKISNIFKKFRTSIVFLIFLVLGYLSGGLAGALSIDILYNYFPLLSAILVIGFILGGIPNMVIDLKDGRKKVSCYIVLIVLLVLLVLFSFVNHTSEQVSLDNVKIWDLVILFFIGVFTSSTLIIPGVDFAILLLALGYYEPLIKVISNLVRFENVLYDIVVLGTYLIGYGLGSFLLSKLIKKVIDKYSDESKYASFAFVIVAPFVVMKRTIFENPNYSFNYPELFCGIILGLMACVLMFIVMRYFRRKKERSSENNV